MHPAKKAGTLFWCITVADLWSLANNPASVPKRNNLNIHVPCTLKAVSGSWWIYWKGNSTLCSYWIIDDIHNWNAVIFYNMFCWHIWNILLGLEANLLKHHLGYMLHKKCMLFCLDWGIELVSSQINSTNIDKAFGTQYFQRFCIPFKDHVHVHKSVAGTQLCERCWLDAKLLYLVMQGYSQWLQIYAVLDGYI